MLLFFDIVAAKISESSDYLDHDEVYDRIDTLINEHRVLKEISYPFVLPYLEDALDNMIAIFNKDNRYNIINIESARLPDSLVFTVIRKEE